MRKELTYCFYGQNKFELLNKNSVGIGCENKYEEGVTAEISTV